LGDIDVEDIVGHGEECDGDLIVVGLEV